jgi:hypothetical protein
MALNIEAMRQKLATHKTKMLVKTAAPNGDHQKEIKLFESFQPKMETRSRNFTSTIM